YTVDGHSISHLEGSPPCGPQKHVCYAHNSPPRRFKPDDAGAKLIEQKRTNERGRRVEGSRSRGARSGGPPNRQSGYPQISQMSADPNRMSQAMPVEQKATKKTRTGVPANGANRANA